MVYFLELIGKASDVVEANGICNLVVVHIGGNKQLQGVLKPHRDQIFLEILPGILFEVTAEIAGIHVEMVCHGFQSQGLCVMLVDIIQGTQGICFIAVAVFFTRSAEE